MSYDEEVTPEIDPPVIEPPPAATLLGRIFSHERPPATVVQAPLVPLPDIPDAPAEEPVEEPAVASDAAAAGAPPPEPEPEPGRGPVAEPEREPVAEPVREPVAESVPPPPAPPRAEPPAPEVATRNCATCGDRVPVAADGLHCHLGHRLSPAHARKRGWFRRG